ncbi:MAG TPA: rhomboid family intramembrane serine protease [Aeromicrobium sp.]|nr:rhomboid family intramembrane serine protease [Aeromicrobium sp.]
MSEPVDAHRARPRALGPVVVPIGFVALLWVVELLDAVLPGRWDAHGIHPRSTEGIVGVLSAPLLHDDWSHLMANSLPLVVLGVLLVLSGRRTFAAVTALVWIVGGAAVWLLAGSGSNHIGASGIVFGWIGYLVARGVFSRGIGQIAIGLLVLAMYWTAIFGVLPGRPGISWQGHLFGAAAGVLAAWLLSEADDEG